MNALRSLRFLLAGLVLVPSLPAQQKTSTPDLAPVSTAPTIAVDARLVNCPSSSATKRAPSSRTSPRTTSSSRSTANPRPSATSTSDTNLPLTLGLLVDTSRVQRGVLDEERTASATFLDQMLNRTDRTRPSSSSSPARPNSCRTSPPPAQAPGRPQEIDSTSSGLRQHRLTDSDASSGRAPRRRHHPLRRHLPRLRRDHEQADGRKALIILSDGVDRGSKESLANAIEAAQRADTIIYAIYFKGEEHRCRTIISTATAAATPAAATRWRRLSRRRRWWLSRRRRRRRQWRRQRQPASPKPRRRQEDPRAHGRRDRRPPLRSHQERDRRPDLQADRAKSSAPSTASATPPTTRPPPTATTRSTSPSKASQGKPLIQTRDGYYTGQ